MTKFDDLISELEYVSTELDSPSKNRIKRKHYFGKLKYEWLGNGKPIPRELRKTYDHKYLLFARLKTGVSANFHQSKWKMSPNTAMEILGCHSKDDAFNRLDEGQFLDLRQHEVDHIIPKHLAETRDEFIALHHISNLRLIRTSANRLKRDILPSKELLNADMLPLALAIYERNTKKCGF